MDWLKCFRLYKKKYRAHAIERMVSRNIRFSDIDEAAENWVLIEKYSDDTPYPSCLVLGFSKRKKPIHLVFSVAHTESTIYIITVYEPTSTRWRDNFQRRKE